MRRAMIIGQPGSGKSTLARTLGEITHLPVVHIDRIHWQPGWVERPRAEKTRLCEAVHATPEWIFEGGHSATWPCRLARADTLVWLDLPVGLRLRRVAARTLRWWGRSRPDLPDGCPEQLAPEFLRYIWRTRTSGRAACARLFAQAGPGVEAHRLRSPAEVRAFVGAVRRAMASGALGLPHR